MTTRLKIKDGRPSDFFRVGNDIVDCEQLDAYAGWVYTVLCRYTSVQDDTCYPSLNTLCSKTKMSKPKLIQCIAQLEKIGLLGVERRKSEGDKNEVNIYTVYGFNQVGVVNDVNHPSKPHLPPLVNDVYPNNTQLIKTQEQPLSAIADVETVSSDTVTVTVIKPKPSKPAKTPKEPAHPLRQRNSDKTPNPYHVAIAAFWAGKPEKEITNADLRGIWWRITGKETGVFAIGSAFELLYAEIGGFTPQDLAQALDQYAKSHPAQKASERPRETKLYDHIAPLLRKIVIKRDGHLLRTPAIDGWLEQHTPSYASSVDITDVRIINGESK